MEYDQGNSTFIYVKDCSVVVELNDFGHYTVINPSIIPLCFWALYIGVTRYNTFKKTIQQGTGLYALCFLMYGIMMTNAMISDSVLNQYKSWLQWLCAYVDIAMTSSIAAMIMFCGLYDLKCIDPFRNRASRYVIAVTIASIWTGWLYFEKTNKLDTGFEILYMDLIIVCCPLYLVFQICYMFKHKVSWRAVSRFLLTGLSGAVGMLALTSPQLCHKFSTDIGIYFFFNAETLWFFFSDLAMYFLASYVIKSRISPEDKDTLPCTTKATPAKNANGDVVYYIPVSQF